MGRALCNPRDNTQTYTHTSWQRPWATLKTYLDSFLVSYNNVKVSFHIRNNRIFIAIYMCYVSMLCWFSSELFCSLMNSGLCCLVSLWSVCGPGEGRIDYLALADLQCVWKIEKNKTKVTVHKAIQTGWRWPWPTAQRFPLYFTRHQLVLFKWALNSFTAETIFYLDEDKGLCFLPGMNTDGWMQNAGTQVNSWAVPHPVPRVFSIQLNSVNISKPRSGRLLALHPPQALTHHERNDAFLFIHNNNGGAFAAPPLICLYPPRSNLRMHRRTVRW